jgi:transketolase
VAEIDGHDIPALEQAIVTAKAAKAGRPQCIIAHTVKGKGISFMENELAWHYRSPRDADYAAARAELGAL